jgi:hypothetical protein
MRVEEAVTAFIEEKNADGVQGEQTYGRKLAHLVGMFGGRFLDEITERELTPFLRGFKDAVTRNDIRKRCGTLFRWARDKKGFLPKGVTTAIERTSRAKESSRRIGIISSEVFAQCLEWMRENQPKNLAALVIAGFCGLRSDEIHGKRIEKKQAADRARARPWARADQSEGVRLFKTRRARRHHGCRGVGHGNGRRGGAGFDACAGAGFGARAQ